MGTDDELSRTQELLRQTIELLHDEQKRHVADIEEFRKLHAELCEHHNQERSSAQDLLVRSEQRIDRTNEMIQKMSQSCTLLVETNRELKDSYMLQFERATSQSKQLLDEVELLRREKESYYASIQKYREVLEDERKRHREEIDKERKRYDDMMSQLVNHLCSGHNQSPIVTIDQKHK